MIIDLKKEQMSISEALFIAKPHDTIILDDIIYYEKIVVDKPFIKMVGKPNTTITYGDTANTIRDGIKLGTTKSATFTVKEEAHDFYAYSITFLNSYEKKSQDGEQAVAFKSEASNTYLNKCKFISYQDTLYFDYGINNLIVDSYICGDIDFIFGSADLVIYNSTITSRAKFNTSYYFAPSTLIQNRYGFVVYKSLFNQDGDIKSYICRPWYPSKQISPVVPKLSVIDSEFVGDISLDVIKMREDHPDYHEIEIINGDFNNENRLNKIDFINKTIDYYKNIEF